MRLTEKFSDSFWSPTSSTELIPNYTIGLNVLHEKLDKSIHENETIQKYLQKRIDIEKQCAELLTNNLANDMDLAFSVENVSMNASLKSSFDMVYHESEETAHYHRVRAGMLVQDVLEPFVAFNQVFQQELTASREKLDEEIREFDHMAQSALMTKAVYWSKCHALELVCPEFRPPVPPGFEEEYIEDQNLLDKENDAFVGARSRSTSVTSELDVDKGGVRLSRFTVLPYRDVARAMGRMQMMIEGTQPKFTSTRQFLGRDVFEWIRDYITSPPPTSSHHDVTIDSESQEICQHLVSLKFLRSSPKETAGFVLDRYYVVQQNVVERYLRKTRIRKSVDYGERPSMIPEDKELTNMTLEAPSASTAQPVASAFNNLLGKLKILPKSPMDSSTKARREMTETDETYKKKVRKVDELRNKLEEHLFAHYDEMEKLEMNRINAIKHAFITMASYLSSTLEILKETYNSITLFQETLKPEQDIHYIIEQYKTGPFCPRPMIYENYYHGAATNQIFGVPLEEVTQMYGSYVPPIISKGIKCIDTGLALKKNDEERLKDLEEIWSKVIPLKKMNEICKELDGLAGSKLKDTLESYELNVLANLIRTYLLELPECLLTFDLYEPVKILYASQQDTESKLLSISKLLTTLPSSNYHTLKALSHHLFKLLKLTKNSDMLDILTLKFSYILMRPNTVSSLNMHDRHPKKLMKDLFSQYDVIFTKDINKAQKSSASRPAIVADGSNSNHFTVTPLKDTAALFNEKTELALKHTLQSIIDRNSIENESGSSTLPKSNETTESPGGPFIASHSQVTLFDDPDHSKPTPRHSDSSTPQTEVVEGGLKPIEAGTMQQRASVNPKEFLDDDDKIDKERLSSDLSLMLNTSEDDAIEINDKGDVDMKNWAPTASERAPNRSRASTKGTLDNVDLDPFFED